jgi:hypothetical protein
MQNISVHFCLQTELLHIQAKNYNCTLYPKYLKAWVKNPGLQVAKATKFCMVMPYICES